MKTVVDETIASAPSETHDLVTDSPADGDSSSSAGGDTSAPAHHRTLRSAALLGSGMAAAMLAVLGWLGVQNYTGHREVTVQAQFVQAARQGALNLTTIDWRNAEADVDRIVNGAAGGFQEDFSSRADAFAEVVKQAQSTSVGTVIDAGLESHTIDTGRALVAVSVTTTTSTEAEQPPRTWRMRITVQRVGGDEMKVTNVEFVP